MSLAVFRKGVDAVLVSLRGVPSRDGGAGMRRPLFGAALLRHVSLSCRLRLLGRSRLGFCASPRVEYAHASSSH